MDFKNVISKKRETIPAPENICDELGNCFFGTFDKEFQKMDFLKINKPSALPNAFNKYRLTMCETARINFDNIILVTAVCNMGLFGTAFAVIYDKRTKKCTSWQEFLPSSKAVISDTLINSAETYSNGKTVKARFINNLRDGEAVVSGYANDNVSGIIDFRVKLSRVSKPGIVSIPLDSNRPHYSHKELFSVEGYLEVNGERFTASENTTAIIDNSRGYYPRGAHFDGIITMGKIEINEKEQYFGFNLARNQSVNQDDYNENIIWLNSRNSLLPPVVFKYKSPLHRNIKDTKGMADVTFRVNDEFRMKLKAGIISIDHRIAFGELSGFVCDTDGNRYNLDGICATGEDKSLMF